MTSKLLLSVLIGIGLCAPATAQLLPAGQDGYEGYLLNTTGLPYSNTYVLDLTIYSGSRASAEVYFEPMSPSAPDFTDGSQSTGSITISSNTALLGQTITIGGVVFTGGVSFSTGASNTVAATNLATAINASSLGLKAQGIAAVVTSTSILNGSAYNYAVTASSPTASVINNNPMVNGSNPGDTLGSQVFNQGSVTGLTLALPVSYGYGNSNAVGGLTQGTTYYAVPLNANSFYLARCSSCAYNQLGGANYITVTSTTSQITAQTHTLNPVAISGTPTFQWQSSDDDVNWTATIFSTSTALPIAQAPNISSAVATTYFYDFGYTNYRYLRLNIVGPTNGAMIYEVPVRIKQDGIGKF